MKQRLWTALPWCLVAVLFFSGAGEGEKPVPRYMQLMLAEEAAQTSLLQWLVYETRQARDEMQSTQWRIASELAFHSMILEGKDGDNFELSKGRQGEFWKMAGLDNDIAEINEKANNKMQKQTEDLIESIAKLRAEVLTGKPK